jgi:putative FmdB family regulatory protein
MGASATETGLQSRPLCDTFATTNVDLGVAHMPLFAYRCRACGEEFQTLVMSGETPICKACASADLDQELSLIASPSKGGEAGPQLAACGAEMGACCGGGACGAFAHA